MLFIVKQTLVNLVVHFFNERRFLVNEWNIVPPRDTQLPFDILSITMLYITM